MNILDGKYEILKKENENYKKEIHLLAKKVEKIEKVLNDIRTAKAYRLWRLFGKLREDLINREYKKIILYIVKGDLIKEYVKNNDKDESANKQYQIWLQGHQCSKTELIRQRNKKFKYEPLLSIITPVYNPNIEHLMQCIESVTAQTYSHWELCLADDCSTNKKIQKILREYCAKDERIKCIFRDKNGHISEASNSALSIAKGQYAVLLDHDDILSPNAMFEVVMALNKNPDAELIYSDEDKISEDGIKHEDPFFKPDWSPDYLRSVNYINHLTVLKKDLVERVGRFRTGFEGAQDWDLLLRATRVLSNRNMDIIHIPKILYSWRKSPTSTASELKADGVKDYITLAQKRALTDDLMSRWPEGGGVSQDTASGMWHMKYKLKKEPLVSIIIPTKNKFDYISRCLKTVLSLTSYTNYEVIVVDTGTDEDNVLNLYKELIKNHNNIKIEYWKEQFNFASVCNYGVSKSRGEYIALLNNDTEIITPNWIENMLSYSQRPEIGVVGCKLLYPDNRIQHVGVILGLTGGGLAKGVAGHAFKGIQEGVPHPMIMGNSIYAEKNYMALTAACIMINKKKYIKVNGLDSKFRIAFNDVDFCLKIRKLGYYNVFIPEVKITHYESISVGTPKDNTRDLSEFNKEINMMHSKWGGLLQNDPFYNLNLTFDREDFSIDFNGERTGIT